MKASSGYRGAPTAPGGSAASIGGPTCGVAARGRHRRRLRGAGDPGLAAADDGQAGLGGVELRGRARRRVGTPRRGQLGYWPRHDADRDGIACEPWRRRW
jgi:hypothetical protein